MPLAQMPSPSLSPATARASSRLSRLASGSPMPMTTTCVSRSSAGSRLRSAKQLLEDLAAGQVARDAVEAAGAEDAAHAAADLRADAGRPAVVLRDQHALDQSAVVQRRSSFCVPSSSAGDARSCVPSGDQASANSVAQPGGRSVMSSNDSARLAMICRRICLTRSGGWPRSASQAVNFAVGIEHGTCRGAAGGAKASGRSTVAAICGIVRRLAKPGKLRRLGLPTPSDRCYKHGREPMSRW